MKKSCPENRAGLVELGGIAVVVSSIFPSLGSAYVGPGAGLSLVGVIVGLLAAVFFAIVGFVWYPVNRLLRARKARKAEGSNEQQAAAEEDRTRNEGL